MRSASAKRLLERLLEIDRLGAEVLAQHEVVEVEHLAQLGGEALAMEQILDADGAARHLVLVGRADAAAGGADLSRPLGRLARAVQRRVVGQDQRTRLAERQPPSYLHAGAFQRVAFVEQRLGRHHHAVADEARHAVAQDARRDQVQDGLLAGDHQGVAGVVPALEPHHRLGMVGEPVDDLAFALVAPLGADDYDIASHALSASHCAAQPRRLQRGYLPLTVSLRERARAAQLRPRVFVAGKVEDDDLALAAQLIDARTQGGIAGPIGCKDTAHAGDLGTQARQLAQVHAEPGRRACAPERLADFIVAPAQRDGIGTPAGVGGEHDPAVIVVAAQLRQIEAVNVHHLAQIVRDALHLVQGGGELRIRGKGAARLRQYLRSAVELRQQQQGPA